MGSAGVPSISQPLLLAVDDEPSVLSFLTRFGEESGFQVVVRQSGARVADDLKSVRPDVILVDLQMPHISGIDVLRAAKGVSPDCHVILMTGHASIDSAIEAVKLGSLDYLSKPLDLQRLGQQLSSVRHEFERRRRLLRADTELASRLNFYGMIGRTPVMQEMFDRIRRLAPFAKTALVTGETGTGKELVARALHALGSGRERRFVSCNCAAISESVCESEFFGHARGAFTGAHEHKAGLFEHADRGTLFLDEVGELPLTMQPKLFRVLEYGELQRVGSAETRHVDVRTIAATNRQLPADIRSGRFREDLYYRLHVVEFHLPPLRERRDDISYLSAAFVQEFSNRFGKEVAGFTAGAERILYEAPWPGNVRQLRHTLERACMMSEGRLLTERDIVGALGISAADIAPSVPSGVPAPPPPERRAVSALDAQQALEQAGGNRSAAARMLGLSRRSFYRRLSMREVPGS